jgi:hypothetical protein
MSVMEIKTSTTLTPQAETMEQELLERYQNQKAKKGLELEYSQSKREDGTIVLECIQRDRRGKGAVLYAATGSTNDDYATTAIANNLKGLSFDRDSDQGAAQAITMFSNTLLEMAPRDVTDGILCRRILTIESQINEFQARAICSTHMDAKNQYVNWTTKLSRLLNETIEARTKYLRQGEQKVTVTHQHVNVVGGQTVIGNVEHGGGANVKK